MSNERFPNDLVVTLEDFRDSGWREVIENAGEWGYLSYKQSLFKAAEDTLKAEDATKKKVLWLLANACSMVLRPESIHEPFKPTSITNGWRSAIPEDFSKSDLAFFESILSEIDDFRLKARLADILWLQRQPRNIQHAHIAIDAYQQFPLDPKFFPRGGKKAWERAIRLAMMLGSGAHEKACKIWTTLFQKFQSLESALDKTVHGFKLAELLDVASIAIDDKDKFKDIATKLEVFAQNAKEEKDFFRLRQYYESAIIWYRKLNSQSDIYRLTVETAESFVLGAQQRTENGTPSYIAAGHFLESAIQTYRKIPGRERLALKVDERLKELHEKMNEANKLAGGEMSEIRTPEIDISEIVLASQNLVKNRSFPEILLCFANAHPGINVKQIRENAEKVIKEHPLHTLFTSTHMTRDGHVAARSPGINLNDPNSVENQQAIWAQMLMRYGIWIGLVVQGTILPALQVVNLEHRLTERTLLAFCRGSPAIPFGREELWVKGLYFGFENDFISSTHLLVPQIEHFVRIAMKENGIRTTTLDSKGIETENGLSFLLDNAEIEKVLGEKLTFEFKALLADSIGANLRNKVAHGLLEADEGMSNYAIYFWWFCLRLVINSIP